MRKNVASQVVTAHLISKADGSDVITGTTTVYVNGDGGTQGAGGGTVTHEGNGEWSYVPTQAETNYNEIAFTFVNSAAISKTVTVYPIGYDPTSTYIQADMVAISGDTTAAYNMSKQARTILVGEVRASGGNSTTDFLTNLTGYDNNFFGDINGGNVMVWISSAANKFQARRVSAYNTGGVFSLESALDVVPSTNDTFILLGRIEL